LRPAARGVQWSRSPPARRTGDAMSSKGSVTCWVTALKGGDAAAAQPLWERYHRELVTLARQKLRSARRREADEEDVVQSAFHSFFQGVARGRFPQLHDRDNLWRLLVVITARKALDQLAREHTKRRGGGTPAGEPRISPGGPPRDEAALEQVVGAEPTPEFAAQVAERLDCSRRTVARKLETIRIIWSREPAP
jgi:DNA-directed RNA polymerase specialized sigma24 family protein